MLVGSREVEVQKYNYFESLPARRRVQLLLRDMCESHSAIQRRHKLLSCVEASQSKGNLVLHIIVLFSVLVGN
jgi:hypothetical protein